MAPLRRLADAAGRLPLPAEVRFARMSGSSIAAPRRPRATDVLAFHRAYGAHRLRALPAGTLDAPGCSTARPGFWDRGSPTPSATPRAKRAGSPSRPLPRVTRSIPLRACATPRWASWPPPMAAAGEQRWPTYPPVALADADRTAQIARQTA